jgi:hypothetical protein
MLAKEYRVPVVVAVETYKFTGGVRLDGLGMNEVDVNWMDEDRGTEGIVKAGEGKDGGGANLTRLALTYDLTPAEYITALCTEVSLSATALSGQADSIDRLHPAKLGPDRHRQDRCWGLGLWQKSKINRQEHVLRCIIYRQGTIKMSAIYKILNGRSDPREP